MPTSSTLPRSEAEPVTLENEDEEDDANDAVSDLAETYSVTDLDSASDYDDSKDEYLAPEPDATWPEDLVERAYRLGSRQHGQRPRPLVAKMLRWVDAVKILGHRSGRNSLKEKQVHMSQDLTKKQQGKLREMRANDGGKITLKKSTEGLVSAKGGGSEVKGGGGSGEGERGGV
ncbi:hypothetical protein ACOMHN_023176 [Nucella lapillus]